MAKPFEVDELWKERISSTLNGLEYGTVQIIVHDGRIVQIERTERKRFDPTPDKTTLGYAAGGHPASKR
ncbi:MAG: YezD family protein [Gorillibacterium sp.]|nr:YezD family protein [Gorillibacterium sp.]